MKQLWIKTKTKLERILRKNNKYAKAAKTVLINLKEAANRVTLVFAGRTMEQRETNSVDQEEHFTLSAPELLTCSTRQGKNGSSTSCLQKEVLLVRLCMPPVVFPHCCASFKQSQLTQTG